MAFVSQSMISFIRILSLEDKKEAESSSSANTDDTPCRVIAAWESPEIRQVLFERTTPLTLGQRLAERPSLVSRLPLLAELNSRGRAISRLIFVLELVDLATGAKDQLRDLRM